MRPESRLPALSTSNDMLYGPTRHGTSMSPGARVLAQVTAFADFGVYLESEAGVRFLVLLPDLELGPGVSPNQAFEIGQTLALRVVHWVPAHENYRATLATSDESDRCRLDSS